MRFQTFENVLVWTGPETWEQSSVLRKKWTVTGEHALNWFIDSIVKDIKKRFDSQRFATFVNFLFDWYTIDLFTAPDAISLGEQTLQKLE